MAKVTAGRDELGEFAPKFAELNDDVLFGQVWSREDKLSARDRSIVTVTALMAGGILDSSLKFHLQYAKNHGVTGEEMSEILTQGVGGIPDGKGNLGRVKGEIKILNRTRAFQVFCCHKL